MEYDTKHRSNKPIETIRNALPTVLELKSCAYEGRKTRRIVSKYSHTSKHGFQYLQHRGDFSLHCKPDPKEYVTINLLCI